MTFKKFLLPVLSAPSLFTRRQKLPPLPSLFSQPIFNTDVPQTILWRSSCLWLRGGQLYILAFTARSDLYDVINATDVAYRVTLMSLGTSYGVNRHHVSIHF